MKTKITIVLLLITVSINLKAQTYVTIPDSYFVTWLQTNFPSCMNGNQMDITCAGIQNDTSVNVYNKSIADLTGIEYFTSLKTLNCSYNLITSLPILSNSVLTLNCGNNPFTNLNTLPNLLQTLYCGNCSQLTSIQSLPNSLVNLYCSYSPLTNLPTLPNTLQKIECRSIQLTSLPTLPNSLINLDCRINQLTTLPTLPNALTILDCSYNQLTSFAPSMPNSLQSLNCENNLLTNLPTLSNSLQTLDCGINQITSLPNFPNSLITLTCRYNNLTSIPTLSNSLQYLACQNNQLTTLPALPNSLQNLLCQNNQLMTLPLMPNSLLVLEAYNNQLTILPTIFNSIQILRCNHNQLTNLPNLPNSLQEINCSHNLLTSLPLLPNSLQRLFCDSNNISCFPIFPTLYNPYFFNISANPFTCLPNYVPAMNSTTLAYPLCVNGDTLNNPSGCLGAKGIIGIINKDNNSNCIMDIGDQTISGIHLKLYDTNSNLLAQTYSFSNGVYYFPDTAGTYTVKIDTAGMPFYSSCTNPGIDSTVTLTQTNPLAKNVNFDIACKPGFDIGVQSVMSSGLVFPGQSHILYTVAGDADNWYNLHCAAGVSGQVQITVTGPVTYNGIYTGALTPSISGNVYTYSIADFDTVNNLKAFNMSFTTNPSAQTGDQICVNVAVTPTVGDNNTNNNNYTFCYSVVNSYDPNVKEVYPVNVLPSFQDYFTYSVHFQNTGTAPAMNIRLEDTLDTNLDIETFQEINYSHYNTVSVCGNILIFHFPNIQLPDSSSNLAGSTGYVQYRIKPKPNLTVGTQIKNTANIYFDYNSAIRTNTTTNEFMISTSVNEDKINTTLNVYPNPSNGRYFVNVFGVTNVSVLNIEVYNSIGKIVLKNKMENSLIQIDLSDFSKGIYFVRIIGGGLSLNQKVLKQ